MYYIVLLACFRLKQCTRESILSKRIQYFFKTFFNLSLNNFYLIRGMENIERMCSFNCDCAIFHLFLKIKHIFEFVYTHTDSKIFRLKDIYRLDLKFLGQICKYKK